VDFGEICSCIASKLAKSVEKRKSVWYIMFSEMNDALFR